MRHIQGFNRGRESSGTISSNLNDLVQSTDIIPAIRTGHDTISIDKGKLENELKGPGHWKMNCSLLEDDAYVNSVTQMLPLWAAEGRKNFRTAEVSGICKRSLYRRNSTIDL